MNFANVKLEVNQDPRGHQGFRRSSSCWGATGTREAIRTNQRKERRLPAKVPRWKPSTSSLTAPVTRRGSEKGFIVPREREYYKRAAAADHLRPKFTKTHDGAPHGHPRICANPSPNALDPSPRRPPIPHHEVEETGRRKEEESRLQREGAPSGQAARGAASSEPLPDFRGLWRPLLPVHFVSFGETSWCTVISSGQSRTTSTSDGPTSLYWGDNTARPGQGLHPLHFLHGTLAYEVQDEEGHGGYAFKKGFGGEVVETS